MTLRSTLPVLIALLLACDASAHFLFVHVTAGRQPRVELHFAESCWDFSADARMVGISSNARVWSPTAGDLSLEAQPHALVTGVDPDIRSACAAFTYGIMRRGEAFLLEYHGKGVSDLAAAAEPTDLEAEILATADGDRLILTVLHGGKPVSDAEIVVPMSGAGVETISTGCDGTHVITIPKTPLFSIRAMVPESKNGTHDDVAYDLVRHYTTLTVHPNWSQKSPSGEGDALATAILGDAVACLATDGGGTPAWRGRLIGRIDGEEIRGSIVGAGAGLQISLGSNADPRIREHLEMLQAMGDLDALAEGDASVADRRSAGPDLNVLLPARGQRLLVKDRRIESTVRATDGGTRRIDVLDWTTTDDGRHLPTRILVTTFNADDSIDATLMLDTSYSVSDGVRLPTSFSGRVVSGSNDAMNFALEVQDGRLR